MLASERLDPLKQQIHRYEVTAAWGSMAKQLRKGDIIHDVYFGEQHSWEVRNMRTLAIAGGFKGRYIGVAGCDGPGNCIIEGDHGLNGAPLSCPNAACAEHHGEMCYTVDELDALDKDRHPCYT